MHEQVRIRDVRVLFDAAGRLESWHVDSEPPALDAWLTSDGDVTVAFPGDRTVTFRRGAGHPLPADYTVDPEVEEGVVVTWD